MDAAQAQQIQLLIADWVRQSDNLRALALCGSWARGDARPDSDIDFLVLAPNISQQFRAQALESIPFAKAGFTREAIRWQTYGVVHSAHITLNLAAKLELTFAHPSWACVDPVDPGTHRVITNGFVPLVDKDGALGALTRYTARRN